MDIFNRMGVIMKKYQPLTIVCLLVLTTLCCSDRLSHEEAFARGNELFKTNNLRRAYSYYKRAIDINGSEPLYHWAAAKSTSNHNLVFIHAQSAWDNGLKTFDVLTVMSALSQFADSNQALQHAISLYGQIPDSAKSHERLGDLFILFSQYDSSIIQWKKAQEESPSSAICVKIAGAYARKGESDQALSVLESCRKEKQLDEQGYIALTYFLAMDHQYPKLDSVFHETYRLGLYTDAMQLEHTSFALLQRDFALAESLSTALAFIECDRLFGLRARVMLAFIYRSTNNHEKIQDLISSLDKENIRQIEGEKELYLSVAGFMRQKNNSLQMLSDARSVLPRLPFVELLYARENYIEGNYKEALAGYRNLPDFLVQYPHVLVGYASALGGGGNDEQALALLSDMHRRKMFSRNSLELFRDLALRNNLIHESVSAQAVLEKLYKDDPGVRYVSAIIAIQKGQLEKALSIVSDLYEEYPRENQFGILMLRVLYLKEEYNAIVEAVRFSEMPFSLYGSILARAFIKLGRDDQAHSTYLDLISKDESLTTLLEYAQFIVGIGDFNKAVTLFDKILNRFSADLQNDSTKYAVILNNFAWSLLQSNQNLTFAQKLAEKAVELLPGNIQIADTYATALLFNKRYRRCIKFIQSHPQGSQSITLLLHLARAFEESADINRAVRTYRDISAMLPEKQLDHPPVNSQWIDEKIALLTTR